MAKHKVQLTDAEVNKLKSIIRNKNTSKMIRSRCQILLDLDMAHGNVLTHEQCARSNGVCMATVHNTLVKYTNGGIETATQYKQLLKNNYLNY